MSPIHPLAPDGGAPTLTRKLWRVQMATGSGHSHVRRQWLRQPHSESFVEYAKSLDAEHRGQQYQHTKQYRASFALSGDPQHGSSFQHSQHASPRPSPQSAPKNSHAASTSGAERDDL
eukprot:Amastigsp_a591_173.p4 type:complete len:118 gc:universal Amastigsp_a591_173:155-508(+)